VAEADDPLPLPQRRRDRLPQQNAGILDGVVAIDMQIPGCRKLQVDQTVPGEGVKQMVEKTDSRSNAGAAGTVQIERHRDGGLRRLPGQSGLALIHDRLSFKASRNQRFSSCDPVLTRR